jgi:transglutaminase-like putative cysteine protease
MKITALLFSILLCATAYAADHLDSLISAQRIRAGDRAAIVFSVLDHPEQYRLTNSEREDLRFLLAYLPLGDLASMSGDDLLENVRLAEKARGEFTWSSQVSAELYRFFILPHRCTQEPFVYWRKPFQDELAPRVRNLSMTAAALEVNHWCHEKATYKPSDSRDQDPLTTIRAGLGRCEEEMILAICALRSVGIPARQCYTPYWAHQDDNHAWVEVWADGKWHYFGACEPEPLLDRGWFTEAAARAMLVVSTAYGEYFGSEPVLRCYNRSTLINSTAVYGSARRLQVTLLNANGIPVYGGKVLFNLWNYGTLMPAMSLETDKNGVVVLNCGRGDWFLSAGSDSTAALRYIPASDSIVTLRLGNLSSVQTLQQANYSPPPKQTIPGAPGDSLFACRVMREDSLRESLWTTWAREIGTPLSEVKQIKPDSVYVASLLQPGMQESELLKVLRNARGNWGQLVAFLTGSFPTIKSSGITYASRQQLARYQILATLSEKDARDFSLCGLEDAVQDFALHTTFDDSLLQVRIAAFDSVSRARFLENEAAPRIFQEPSIKWRQFVVDFFTQHSALVTSQQVTALLNWLRTNITVESPPDRDRLGPPLTPAQTLELRRGTQRDLEVLYVGLCRVREIPARLDPVTNRVQRWSDSSWADVTLQTETKKAEPAKLRGKLFVEAVADTTLQTAKYYKDWCVALWDKDHLEDVDFGYLTPYREQKWPQELPAGIYCLSSGFRRADGSAPASFHWFTIEAGKDMHIPLSFR